MSPGKGAFRPWIHKRYLTSTALCALLPVCLLALWQVRAELLRAPEGSDGLREAQLQQLSLPVLGQARVIETRLDAIGTYTVLLQSYAETALKSPEIYGAQHSSEGGIGTAAASGKPAAGADSKPGLDNPILYTKGQDGALRKLLDNKGTAVIMRARPEGQFTQFDKQRLYATAALDPLLIKGAADPLIAQAFLLTGDGLLRTAPFIDTSTIAGDRDLTQQPIYAWSKDKANDRGLVWTSPYASFMHDGWVCACLAPVMVGSKRVGVVGCEVALSEMPPELLSFSLGPGARGWLRRDDGVVLATTAGSGSELGVTSLGEAPLPSEDMPAKLQLEAANLLLKGNPEVAEVLSGTAGAAAPVPVGKPDEGRYAVEADVGATGWKAGAVLTSPVLARMATTTGKAASRSGKVLVAAALAVLLGLLLATLVSWLESRRVTQPLKVLTQRVRQVISGRPGSAVAIADEGEIGNLAAAVQNLIDRQNSEVG